MKLWLIERAECDYDEFDSFVIRAEDEAAARAIADKEAYGFSAPGVTCKEIPMEGDAVVVHASFRAG